MSAQKRIVFGALGAVALLAGFWFLLLSPKRAEVKQADALIVQAQARRTAALAALAVGVQARAHYDEDYATVARLGKAVPADDDVASLVYQLETIARANKIDFRSVRLTGAAAAPTPTLTGPPSADGKDDKGADSTDPSASKAPVAPVVAQPPPGAVVGTAGLLTVPFTFTFDGSYMEMQRFIKAINGLANSKKDRITVHGRLLTIDGFSLASGSGGFPDIKATVGATAYLAPQTDPVSATEQDAPPAGGAASSSSTTALVTSNAQGAGR